MITSHRLVEILEELISHCNDLGRLRTEFVRVDPDQANLTCNEVEKIRIQLVKEVGVLQQDLTPVKPASVQDMRATSQAAADFWKNNRNK